MVRLRLFLDWVRTHAQDIHNLGYLVTVLVAVAGFTIVFFQLRLQTEAVKLQTEAVKLQTDAVRSQNEQIRFQREALESQIKLNKPIITQNVVCPPLQANTVNHVEFAVYNIGRSSGVYTIRFEANSILLRAMSFSCNTFLDYCATGPNYAISAGEKKNYMVDIKIGDNALNPSFSVRTQCTSEDCASELPKTWTCRYYYDSVTQLYEPLAPPEMS